MAYLHDAYTSSQPQPVLYQPVSFPQFANPQQPPFNGFYNPYSAEYGDFAPHGSMQDEYEEGTENLTRPRLTKDQVDVLEAQFQAHPKPNSMVKRQLASQTKLTLPRVANWFQNRRAKAKQQRKQEEFEVNQTLGTLQEGWQSESSLVHRPADKVEESTQIKRERSFTESSSVPPQSSTASLYKSPEEFSKDKSWESLQRVLDARKQAAQQDQTSMPPPALPRQIQTQMLSPPQDHMSATAPVSAFSDWSSVASSTSWSTVQPSIEQFDFGFDPLQEDMSSDSDHTPTGTHESLPTQTFSMDSDWPETLHHPVPTQQPVQFAQLDPTAIQDLTYPSSRRGSMSDELTTNFNTFALAGTTSPAVNHFPQPPQRSDSGESMDLATRRKRPRPAALGSAAIRSRSYGALSSTSPTFRANPQMPSGHAIRHVKSTGHSLNARYAGIRKTSSAQRSPLNVASFAEVEAFKSLMAQRTLLEGSNEGTHNNTPLMSPPVTMDSQMSAHQQHAFYPQEMHASAQYPPSASTCYSTFQSPPVTPFRPDFFMPSQQPNLMPPVSAGLQYATFPEQTPPYSAGPLTSSSWSDAPLTSPDMANFPLMPHMPSMAYSLSTDMAARQYRHFMNADKSEISPTLSEQKKTEFFIHEFPGQKEEHAHVAQQLAQQKPKTYVFANATPNDY